MSDYDDVTSEYSYCSEYSYKSDDVEEKYETSSNTYSNSGNSSNSDINETQSNFTIIPLTEINNTIEDIIENLKIKTNYSYDKLLNLLLQFGWKDEHIYNMYLDTIAENTLENDVTDKQLEDLQCSICFDDLNCDNIVTINDCNHILCKECFINNYKININLRCPMYKCYNNCYLSLIKYHINESNIDDCDDIIDKYNKYIINDYININNLLIYCPSQPYCGNVILKNIYSNTNMIKCNCGETLCFGCKEITYDHEPLSCIEKKNWLKTIENESFSYISQKCKECPWCDRLCEKISGCNFLTCSTIAGKYWCWLCGGKVFHTEHTYTSIKGHSCKKPDKDDKEDDTNFKKHHMQKYNNHLDSIKLDIKNINQTNDDMIDNNTVSDVVEFVNEQYLLLLKARNYIMYINVVLYNNSSLKQNNLLSSDGYGANVCHFEETKFETVGGYESPHPRVNKSNYLSYINNNLLSGAIDSFEYILEFYASSLDTYKNSIYLSKNNIDKCDFKYIELLNSSSLILKNMKNLEEFLYSIE